MTEPVIKRGIMSEEKKEKLIAKFDNLTEKIHSKFGPSFEKKIERVPAILDAAIEKQEKEKISII